MLSRRQRYLHRAMRQQQLRAEWDQSVLETVLLRKTTASVVCAIAQNDLQYVYSYLTKTSSVRTVTLGRGGWLAPWLKVSSLLQLSPHQASLTGVVGCGEYQESARTENAHIDGIGRQQQNGIFCGLIWRICWHFVGLRRIVWHSRKYTHNSISGGELNEKTDATLVSVH